MHVPYRKGIFQLINAFYHTNIPDREQLLHFPLKPVKILPIGHIMRTPNKITPAQIGLFVRNTRRKMGVTQKELALTSNTGLRFIGDLERGKPTCQIGKVVAVLQTLGIQIDLIPPIGSAE